MTPLGVQTWPLIDSKVDHLQRFFTLHAEVETRMHRGADLVAQAEVLGQINAAVATRFPYPVADLILSYAGLEAERYHLRLHRNLVDAAWTLVDDASRLLYNEAQTHWYRQAGKY